MLTPEQTIIDQGVADSIKKNIADDLEDVEKQKTGDTKQDDVKTGEDSKKTTDKDPDKKPVDKTKKVDDTDSTDETRMFDAVVTKIVNEEFDGDNSKIEEAKKIANVAIKTFDGDPIKAAKSYKHLADQNLQLKQLFKQNPFIERLIKEAQEKGQTIDENYVKSLLGTATSKEADQPTKPDGDKTTDQLPDDLNAKTFMNMSADQLIEAGVLDKTRYQAETPAGKQNMVHEARLNYAFQVAPSKIAEKAVKLTEEKQTEAAKKKRIENAKNENKRRLDANKDEVVRKYNVDFENNPHHAALWDEIQQVAYKIPDLEDDSNMLVAKDAAEQAVRHVFSKHNIPLEPTVSPNVDPDNPTETKKTTLNSFNQEAYERILGDVKGFKGKGSKQPASPEKGEDDGSLDSEVQKKVNNNIQRSYRNSHLISGSRNTDRRKGQ